MKVRVFCNNFGVVWFINLDGYKDIGSMNTANGGLGTWRGHADFDEDLLAQVAWAYRQKYGLNPPPDGVDDIELTLNGIGDYAKKQGGLKGI